MKTLYTIFPFAKKLTYRKKSIRTFISRVLGPKKRMPLSENDYNRLITVLRKEKKKGQIKNSRLVKFRYILKKADIIPIGLVPMRLITMNSNFIVKTARRGLIKLSIVYPEDADKAKGRISVFSWLGMTLLGREEDETIMNNIYIQRILYQPEARSDFHL